MTTDRFDRQVALFGSEGQAKLRAAKVAVVGVGGVGSAVIGQLALLGMGTVIPIEHEELDTSNRNRHWCAQAKDPVPGSRKVDLAERMIHGYDPSIRVEKVPHSLITPEGFAAVLSADFVFGCVDREGVRLVLNELCAAYDKPYIDIATDVVSGPPIRFGGRVCCAVGGNGCLSCLGQIDVAEAREDLETPQQRSDRENVYGVNKAVLGRSGPSVVSVNTVVAGLAVTEFMKLCTGLCSPARLITYYGDSSRAATSRDVPKSGCWFCAAIRGAGASADVERYLSVEQTREP